LYLCAHRATRQRHNEQRHPDRGKPECQGRHCSHQRKLRSTEAGCSTGRHRIHPHSKSKSHFIQREQSMKALPLDLEFGLAPCGVYPASGVTDGAVRSYRTISPLPLRGAALWTNPQAIPGRPPEGGLAEAVSFLWHWPSAGFDAHIPDVIRHTALRSSDFPPPAEPACANPPAATARSSCQLIVYRE